MIKFYQLSLEAKCLQNTFYKGIIVIGEIINNIFWTNLGRFVHNKGEPKNGAPFLLS